jgi:transcriptional regulator with PAS, ATPase and Fis domain
MNAWMRELPAEVTICDPQGTVLALNAAAEVVFASDGGADLLGTNLLECHPQEARAKLEAMLAGQTTNAYFSRENGEKRFFFQSPWYRDGQYAGFIEISFPVPEEIPHFKRG